MFVVMHLTYASINGNDIQRRNAWKVDTSQGYGTPPGRDCKHGPAAKTFDFTSRITLGEKGGTCRAEHLRPARYFALHITAASYITWPRATTLASRTISTAFLQFPFQQLQSAHSRLEETKQPVVERPILLNQDHKKPLLSQWLSNHTHPSPSQTSSPTTPTSTDENAAV